MSAVCHAPYSRNTLAIKPKYQDASTARALNRLSSTKGEISGQALQQAIISGTQDLDNQAAGKEFSDIQKWVSANWNRLSPDAKAKYRVYAKYAKAAQSKGKTGIDKCSYQNMSKEMKAAGYSDASAGKAIENLKADKGPISGHDMSKAIISATKDKDAQAAGKEYADLKKFVAENGARMTPEAKAKFATYEKYVKAAKAKGQTGIDSCSYDKMVKELRTPSYQDASSGKAVETLKQKKGTISGDDMQKAIVDGTKDLDSQAAGKEYADLKKFATENWGRMSPDAREKFRVYEKYVKSAKAQGQTGIKKCDYHKMTQEMKTAGYKDASSAKAIEKLKAKNGTISGSDMEKAIINGTKDLDSQAAGKEYADLKKFATENWDRMSPAARQKFRTYEKYAKAAQAKGQSGIDSASYKKMVGEMKTAGYKDASSAKAIEELKSKQGPITGSDIQRAIFEGTKDLDSQAAGKEFADFQKFAAENWDRMTPSAKAKFRVYQQYAQSARARGLSGIPKHEYECMKWQMRGTGYLDQSAGKAIEKLESKPGYIDSNDLIAAIRSGVSDLDGQGAGKEFADFYRFATQNWHRMTPDAQAAFTAYAAHAQNAWMQGSTGIQNMGGLVSDMQSAAQLSLFKLMFCRI
ncbi:MAG: hypothetical protein VYC39_00785 [Myxococcota bacterium]|nr:hypothetical protein [Myxococcota bacterium]